MSLDLPAGTAARPFWEAAAEGRLVVQCCAACGHRSLLARGVCPACLREALTWVDAKPHGTVVTVTRVNRTPSPEVEAGYQLAVVRLADTSQLLARVEDGEVSIGTTVQVGFGPPDSLGRRPPVVRSA